MVLWYLMVYSTVGLTVLLALIIRAAVTTAEAPPGMGVAMVTVAMVTAAVTTLAVALVTEAMITAVVLTMKDLVMIMAMAVTPAT